MPCDCDSHSRVDLWVGGTLCQRCPACGAVRVAKDPGPPHMEPPASAPEDDSLLRWGVTIIAAFLAGALLSGLWALLAGP